MKHGWCHLIYSAWRRQSGDLIAICLLRERRKAGTDLSSVVTSDQALRNGMKLHQERFRMDIRSKVSFTQRVIGHWIGLTRKNGHSTKPDKARNVWKMP